MLMRIRNALSFIHTDPDSENRRSMKDALINAAIVAGFNFFCTLSGMTVAQIVRDPAQALVAAGVAAGLGFFARLMIERGLKR